jgi:hypothetical protein
MFTYIYITEWFVCGITWKDIGNVNRYASTPTPDTRTSEKEHVVIALNVELEDRVGVLILDTGYHVPQPVTVMKDGLYPHTGSNLCSYITVQNPVSMLTLFPFYVCRLVQAWWHESLTTSI